MSKSSAYWHMTFHKYTIRLSSIMTIRCLKIFTMCLPIWNGHIVEREHSRQTDVEFRKCSAFVDETAPCFLADYTKKARYKPDFKNIKEIGHTGFEPVNYGFRVHCLTIWLIPNKLSWLLLTTIISIHNNLYWVNTFSKIIFKTIYSPVCHLNLTHELWLRLGFECIIHPDNLRKKQNAKISAAIRKII